MKKNSNESKLDALGVKYVTDKSSLMHGYLEKYEDMLPKSMFAEKIVEIGLQRGGKWRTDQTMPSVRMWLDYYPEATVYGFDKQYLSSFDSRFIFYRGDQSRMYDHIRFGEIVGYGIDVLLDDGSHRPSHQLLTFLYFWPKISKYGCYVIEDCNAVVQNEYPENHRIHELIKPYLVDKVHYWVDSQSAGPQSSLVIIKK